MMKNPVSLSKIVAVVFRSHRSASLHAKLVTASRPQQQVARVHTVGSRWFLIAVLLLPMERMATAQSEGASRAKARNQTQPSPLASKEKMVRDRMNRFRERVFDLRGKLADTEPENAAKLARVLERAGSLGLSTQLDEIIALLQDPAQFSGAVEEQDAWVEKAERLLDILLARDDENPQREQEMGRLETYKKEVSKLLERERAMRDHAARAAILGRMKQQFEQFQRRIEAQQQQLSDIQSEDGAPQSGDKTEQPNDKAEQLDSAARETGDLAQDMKLAGETAPSPAADSPEAKAARDKATEASQAVQEAAEAMQDAVERLQKQDDDAAQADQERAMGALQEAKSKIESALQDLESQSSTQGQAGEQQKAAQDTQELSQRMRGGGESQPSDGPPQQQHQQQSQPPPGLDNLDRAGDHMEDAAESLEQNEPAEATEDQERAIEALEQTQEELEEMLNQLRKEDRAEMLRGLEVRFRDLLGRQRAINTETDTLAETGTANFTRADRLLSAELGERQRSLAARADSCEHILAEEGTTIVFPRVVRQLATDMNAVATRLTDIKIDPLTQTMQDELVETLEQLLEAVKRMQQENEQQDGMQMESDETAPLLPTSAELKLLRSSQVRVNQRTAAIETMRQIDQEAAASLLSELKEAAARQAECAEIARELHERKNQP